MNVFIDTNVFLSFYHLTNDDLEELEKLAVLLDNNKVLLWLPEQVKDELLRNRESKISEGLSLLKKHEVPKSYPAMCKNFDEYARLRQYEKDFKKEHSALIQKLEEATISKTLKSDTTIERLLESAQSLPLEKDIVERARLRHELRNPPGKKTDALGDTINWETLLDKVPNNETLYFVGDDGDYYSPIDRQAFNEFLLEEWMSKKDSKLIPYRSLSEFFKEHFPNIKLAAELEKELLIRDFATSSSFIQTHTLVRRLERYTEFTSDQIGNLAQAAIYNSQISFIIEDPDVKSFLKPLIEEHPDSIEKRELRLLRRILDIEEGIGDEEDEEYEEMYLPWPD
jgi:hypothetical protein